MKPTEIKILYLAKYAPSNNAFQQNVANEDIVYAQYHQKVHDVLKTIFPKLISSNDYSIVLQKDLSCDYIFSLCNKMPFRNSEVFVSSVAEYRGIPYLGGRPNIRALAEDKHLAKMMAKYAHVQTPAWKIYGENDNIGPPDFDPPYFIKPRFGAASYGISEQSICKDWVAAKKQIVLLLNNGIDVILEKQIIGVYHTCPVLLNFGEAFFLPCVAQYSQLKNGVVTYGQKRKFEGGLYREIQSNKQLTMKMHNASKKMFALVQPLDYTRFDYIVEETTNEIFFLEFNVCCNLGEHSTLSQSASSVGIDYRTLIANITYSSLYRSKLIDDFFGKKF